MKNILLLICFLAYLLQGQAQTLYGITLDGGKRRENVSDNGAGTIIKFTPGSNNLTVARSFETDEAANPAYSDFIQASDGKLYGTAMDGWNSNYGVILSYDPSTSTYTRLKNFDNTNGAFPAGGLVQASDGKLYGMTYGGGSIGYGNVHYGVIYSYNPATSVYTKLLDFDGINGGQPSGSLIQASDGKLYGTAGGGSNGFGVIFSFDPSTSTYTRLKDFDGSVSGAFPNGSLVQAGNGKLYGMTNSGGNSQQGVIFSFDPSTSTYTKLKDFVYNSIDGSAPLGSLMLASNGKLYGMTWNGGSNLYGVIFSFDPSTSTYKKLRDFDKTNGAYPAGNLVQAGDGKLYGTTYAGGNIYPGDGVLFSFNPSNSTFTKLKDFDNTNGMGVYSSLVQAGNGNLYGISDFGVIFSFNPSASTYAKLTDLNINDGRDPYSSLVQASDGKLYGMTDDGGSGSYPDGRGVIFSYDPSTSLYAKLADFTGYNGRSGLGSLIQATNGKLYGMTWSGGPDNTDGVVFSYDLSSSRCTKLLNFDGTHGAYPYGSLMQAGNGKLYGMTYGGGTGSGVLFSLDPAVLTSFDSYPWNTSCTKLVDFVGTNGYRPTGNLMQATNGKLYGMTTEGGRNGLGVIFSFDPASSTYKKLEDFDGTNGAYPFGGGLVQANDGKLYGMTNGGGSSGRGIIFSFDLQRSNLTKLKDFDSTNGAYPSGSLMQASNGKLYGMTTGGGSSNLGVVFSFDPSTSTFTKLQDFNGTNGAHPYLGSAFIEVSPATALPVAFLSFDGELINEQAVLYWSTADESNNKGYDVERSEDGINFLKIGFVPAKGNAASVVLYSFIDIHFKKPVRFYRLKQLDSNGHFTYSSVIQINASNANSYRVNIAPNPSSNVTTISFFLPQSGKVSLKIVDQFGRLIIVLASRDMQAGNHEIKWELSMPDSRPVPAGIYFLRMETENHSETKRISVIR